MISPAALSLFHLPQHPTPVMLLFKNSWVKLGNGFVLRLRVMLPAEVLALHEQGSGLRH